MALEKMKSIFGNIDKQKTEDVFASPKTLEFRAKDTKRPFKSLFQPGFPFKKYNP